MNTAFRHLAAAAFGLAVAVPAHAETVSGIEPLVSVDWLIENQSADNLVVLDLRAPTSDKENETSYASGHLPMAVNAPYPKLWRTNIDGVVGILPELPILVANIENLGISNDTAVVIVPEGTGSSDFGAAARVYWTLTYLGLDDVAILDGGLKAWAAAGQPVSTDPVTPGAELFDLDLREDLLVSTADVKQRVETGGSVLLDARPAIQFKGKEKHVAARTAGRLPGSVNLDHDNLYDTSGERLKSLSQLGAAVPDSLPKAGAQIVSYCNTGHWAATNWFVLHELLGYRNTTLYDDSMVGWTQDAGHPVVNEAASGIASAE